MKIIIQIITGLALLLWFAGLIGTITFIATSTIMEWRHLLIFSLITLYPAIIGLIFYLKKWDFLFLSPTAFAVAASVIPTLVFIIIFGHTIKTKLQSAKAPTTKVSR